MRVDAAVLSKRVGSIIEACPQLNRVSWLPSNHKNDGVREQVAQSQPVRLSANEWNAHTRRKIKVGAHPNPGEAQNIRVLSCSR